MTLAGLEGRRLTKVDASRNQLTDVGALLSVTGLEELDLRLNRISQIPPVLARRFPAAFDGNPGHEEGVWQLHLADRAEERGRKAETVAQHGRREAPARASLRALPQRAKRGTKAPQSVPISDRILAFVRALSSARVASSPGTSARFVRSAGSARVS